MMFDDFASREPTLAGQLKHFVSPQDIIYDVVYQDGRWEAHIGIERAEFEIDIAFTGPCEAIGQECERVWHWEPCRTTRWWDEEEQRYCELRE